MRSFLEAFTFELIFVNHTVLQSFFVSISKLIMNLTDLTRDSEDESNHHEPFSIRVERGRSDTPGKYCHGRVDDWIRELVAKLD